MNLIDVCDVDHRKRRINDDSSSRLFKRFTTRRLRGCFGIFHESGRQGPVTQPRFDGASTKQDAAVPLGNAADDHTRVFVMDVTAIAADVTG